MKKLLLFWLFSGSLDSFSQLPDTTQPPRLFDASKWGYPVRTNDVKDYDWYKIVPLAPPASDTLRAIVLVTLSPNGIAHSRMGFVVISEGKRPVYLDCQKKALKLPQVGWGYQVVNPKEKVR